VNCRRLHARASIAAAAFAVAMLASAALSVGDADAAGRSVSIANFQYSPTPLTVEIGETVTWKNEGFVSHTVTADGGAFDSGTMRGGTSFSFKFTSPGDFKYSCSIHPQMHGEVIVKSPSSRNGMPMPMPQAPTQAPEPAAPVPDAGSSGPVGIAIRVSPRGRGARTTTVAVRTTRAGATILFELYSREHFSWRQVAHAKAGATGAAALRLRASVRLPLRVVVPGGPGEAASISATVHA
jgi:plastocyanin